MRNTVDGEPMPSRPLAALIGPVTTDLILSVTAPAKLPMPLMSPWINAFPASSSHEPMPPSAPRILPFMSPNQLATAPHASGDPAEQTVEQRPSGVEQQRRESADEAEYLAGQPLEESQDRCDAAAHR